MMGLTGSQEIMFSRYGIYPYNWIIEGKLMGSVYPKSIEYLNHLREEEGVTLAINLTDSQWPDDWRRSSGIRCLQYPIVDMMTPGVSEVKEIIREIDSNHGAVMVHCAAGIGRTGTVIGSYLVDKGMEPKEAIETVRAKRLGSIQTRGQEKFVENWPASK